MNDYYKIRSILKNPIGKKAKKILRRLSLSNDIKTAELAKKILEPKQQLSYINFIITSYEFYAFVDRKKSIMILDDTIYRIPKKAMLRIDYFISYITVVAIEVFYDDYFDEEIIQTSYLCPFHETSFSITLSDSSLIVSLEYLFINYLINILLSILYND